MFLLGKSKITIGDCAKYFGGMSVSDESL